MILNEIGEIAKKYWQEIPKHFPNVILDAFVMMPNHIHGIVVIYENNIDDIVGARHGVPKIENNSSNDKMVGHGQPLRATFQHVIPGSLSIIVNQFKGAITKWCRQNNFGGFCWQRNYYEHIIRNEKSLEKLRDYIQRNPQKWQEDSLFAVR